MKKVPKPQALNLEKNELWQHANEIAEQVYGQLHEFPDEEKWLTENKLRGCSNDLLWAVSQAASLASPSSAEYEWGQARKQAGSLKTMYRFAIRQKFVEVEPGLMVKLDQLIKSIDKKVQEAHQIAQENNERELELYRERVRLWHKANEEPREVA